MKNITLLIFLITSSLSCSFMFRTAHAQSPPPPPPDTNYNINNVSSTLPMLFTVFLFAVLITVSCSIFIRFCSPQPHAPFQPTRRRGIDPSVLATCPVISYIKTKAKKASQCAVCLAEFDNGDALRVLPTCGHVFHTPCIDAWLSAHVTCPVCRGEVGVDIEGVARARHLFDESSVRGSDPKMLRSHSTGHSLEGSVVIGMKRSASYDVVLRIGERGEVNNNNNWVVWSMTPPFLSIRKEKECEGRSVLDLV